MNTTASSVRITVLPIKNGFLPSKIHFVLMNNEFHSIRNEVLPMKNDYFKFVRVFCYY